MNRIPRIAKAIQRTLHNNSPSILSGLGVAGIAATGYLSARAGYRHGVQMFDKEEDLGRKEEAAIVWRLYIPPVVTGVVATGCVIASLKVGHRRTAAMTAAYTITDTAFSEYRDKITEMIGEDKEKEIRDEITQDRMQMQPVSKESLIVGSGEVLCYEKRTGRYFQSDMETIRRAQNDVNYRIINNLYVTLDEFYWMIGLSSTSESGDMGWNSDKLLEMDFSAVLAEDNRPCMAIEYNYLIKV